MFLDRVFALSWFMYAPFNDPMSFTMSSHIIHRKHSMGLPPKNHFVLHQTFHMCCLGLDQYLKVNP